MSEQEAGQLWLVNSIQAYYTHSHNLFHLWNISSLVTEVGILEGSFPKCSESVKYIEQGKTRKRLREKGQEY